MTSPSLLTSRTAMLTLSMVSVDDPESEIAAPLPAIAAEW
jgi:hypothetical protein